MHITDDSDKPVNNYNPVIDEEIDIYAPYIDFDMLDQSAAVQPPENGVYDVLFYKDTPLMTVGQVSEIEIRFYSTEVPNEKYRTGQKHIKARVVDIKINDDTTNGGYIFQFDSSKQWNSDVNVFTIDKEYLNTVRARSICILYFNHTGRVTGEFVVPASAWCTADVYLNTAFEPGEDPEFKFKVGDIVDTIFYKKIVNSNDNSYKIVEEEATGRISELELTTKKYQDFSSDSLGDKYIEYFLVSIDISEEYNSRVIRIADTVIKSMKIHKIVPEV